MYNHDNAAGKTFTAGRLKNFINKWRNITSDKFILDIVEHCHLEFIDNCRPIQKKIPFQRNFDKTQELAIDTENN